MTSPLASIVRDRRVWLFLLLSALAAIVAFFAVPDYAAIVFVSRAGFWLVLAAFVLFLRALWLTFREDLRAFSWRRLDAVSVLFVAVGGTVLLVHETFGFKIVMDEIMLLGTSMSMHLDKTVLTPVRGADIQGAFQILDGMMDKRPLFFPFLVSLLHDFTGYRPANAFILNGALTFLFLGLIDYLGRRLAGRLAGWLGVILFAGLPLLAHNATGGGFELLNMLMILVTLLLGARFAEKRDEASFTAFCFSALLLMQVRYESVVWLLPVAALVLWVWWQEQRAILPWPVLVAPLLMVHYPMQHRIFDLRTTAWELGSKPEADKVFALHYVPDNLAHAASYFFESAQNQPNSLVLSVLGCLAIPLFALLVIRRLPALRAQSPINLATTLFALGFAAQFALMMCYFWGRFDDIVIRRLSLPTQLGMVVAILAVLPQFSLNVLRTLLIVSTAGLLSRSIPSMSAHAYSQEYLAGLETAWRRKFIAEQPRHDYMVIDNDSILWIAHEVTSTPVFQARGPRRESLAYLMRNHVYSDVYVFQRFMIDDKTGHMTLRDGDDLGPDFVLETVREERLQTLTLTRLSRVKEIREGPNVVSTPDKAEHTVPRNRAEIEQARAVYLENFMKMLP